MTLETPGLLLLHKRVGRTSATLMREVAASAIAGGSGELPACHAGTLDPLPPGLLVVTPGQATRAVYLLHDVSKEYEAEVTWGAETANGDPPGTVATGDVCDLPPERMEADLAEHVGWRDQVPPTTSAQRVDGEYAYRRAHRGDVFTLAARASSPTRGAGSLTTTARATRRVFLRRGGYYVRSLERDLSRALGTRTWNLAVHARRSVRLAHNQKQPSRKRCVAEQHFQGVRSPEHRSARCSYVVVRDAMLAPHA